jgi:PQQ-dependent catabolism-associated CXXCW motif protein
MTEIEYDELAKFLREMAGRFGETAFTDRRRLVSLLSDHMPEARREIRVVGSAVDERVFEALARVRPEQLDLEIERLGAKMEDGLGIRSDVAIPVIRACAYGLSVGPLPSSSAIGAQPQSWVGETQKNESWVGLSEPVRQGSAVQSRPGSDVAPMNSAAAQPWKSWLVKGGGAAVAVLVVLGVISSYNEKNDQPQPQPQPAPQPSPPQPPIQPVRPPDPTPQPYVPPPQPYVPPQPNVPPQQPYAPPPVQPPADQPSARYFGNENIDFHVAPQSTLKSNVGSPTPLTIPGAVTVMTAQVAGEMQSGRKVVLIDSLADQHQMTIKGAVYLPNAGKFGTFNDQFQTALANSLTQLTQGRRDTSLVFFCQGVNCWESYNAALRAKSAGYQNVYWYRGGLAAWQDAGLPMQPLR